MVAASITLSLTRCAISRSDLGLGRRGQIKHRLVNQYALPHLPARARKNHPREPIERGQSLPDTEQLRTRGRSRSDYGLEICGLQKTRRTREQVVLTGISNPAIDDQADEPQG